jgi:enamine deaminase RidA (YjgF/YER057c/UK114 family)
MKRIEPHPKAQSALIASGILAGDDLFISGQVGVDKTDGKAKEGVVAQAATALANLVEVVATAGGSVEDVAKLTIYVADMVAFQKEGGAFSKVLSGVFSGDHVPAMTLVGVTALISQDYLIEIEGHAKISTR